MWTQTRGRVVLRGFFVFFLSAWAVFDTFRICLTGINAYEMSHDFPPGQLQTYTFYWPVNRAYSKRASSGKGSGVTRYFAQLTPAWIEDWQISHRDFNYMRTHNRPENTDLQSYQVISKGWFCTRVTLQKAGTAVRILNVTERKGLPDGSFAPCPAGAPTLAANSK